MTELTPFMRRLGITQEHLDDVVQAQAVVEREWDGWVVKANAMTIPALRQAVAGLGISTRGSHDWSRKDWVRKLLQGWTAQVYSVHTGHPAGLVPMPERGL